jgi:hypothetical protein
METMFMLLVKILGGILLALAGLVGIGWIGSRIQMTSFAVPNRETRDLGMGEPPADLPVPVARFVQAAFGGTIPLVETGMVMGKADVSFNGLPFPTRFKFYYEAGKGYYHMIQSGWFGTPFFTVNEQYRDGKGILDIPGNHVENEPKVNAAANQGLWAEMIWLPSIWFTDSRVRWEAVDDKTARLILPDASPEEMLTIRFDAGTGLITELSAMRYQNFDSPERILWTDRILEWTTFNGVRVPSVADIRWGDAAPWVTWHVETVLNNVDVSGRFAQYGGDYND